MADTTPNYSTPSAIRSVTSYPARRGFKQGPIDPSLDYVIGVEDAIDIHCHAHEGQQDALGVAKLALLVGKADAKAAKAGVGDVQRVRILNEEGPAASNSARRLDAPQDYLSRYGRFTPAQIWQNLNMTPDFPTVGKLIANLYPQSGGEPIDGVIAVDPLGLRTLLEFTGPGQVLIQSRNARGLIEWLTRELPFSRQ